MKSKTKSVGRGGYRVFIVESEKGEELEYVDAARLRQGGLSTFAAFSYEEKMTKQGKLYVFRYSMGRSVPLERALKRPLPAGAFFLLLSSFYETLQVCEAERLSRARLLLSAEAVFWDEARRSLLFAYYPISGYSPKVDVPTFLLYLCGNVRIPACDGALCADLRDFALRNSIVTSVRLEEFLRVHSGAPGTGSGDAGAGVAAGVSPALVNYAYPTVVGTGVAGGRTSSGWRFARDATPRSGNGSASATSAGFAGSAVSTAAAAAASAAASSVRTRGHAQEQAQVQVRNAGLGEASRFAASADATADYGDTMLLDDMLAPQSLRIERTDSSCGLDPRVHAIAPASAPSPAVAPASASAPASGSVPVSTSELMPDLASDPAPARTPAPSHAVGASAYEGFRYDDETRLLDDVVCAEAGRGRKACSPPPFPAGYVKVERVRTGRRYKMFEGIYTVGRSPSCSLRIRGAQGVSGVHASIRVEGGRAFVKDLNSTNGTFVDGTPLRSGEERPLSPGSRLIFGSEEFTVK